MHSKVQKEFTTNKITKVCILYCNLINYGLKFSKEVINLIEFNKEQRTPVNTDVLARLTPEGLDGAADQSYYAVAIHGEASVAAMETAAGKMQGYNVRVIGEPGDLVYTDAMVSVDRSGNRKDHKGNVYFYFTSGHPSQKVVPYGSRCIELRSSTRSDAADFWRAVNETMRPNQPQ